MFYVWSELNKKNLHVIVIIEVIGQTFRIFSKSKRIYISAVAYYTNFTLSLPCNGIFVNMSFRLTIIVRLLQHYY